MKKIPSVFERDWDGDRRYVLDKIVVDIPKEAIPTRKYDGTAVLIKDGVMYKRYDCKRGRAKPNGFIPCGPMDEKTGHWVGWLIVSDRPDDLWHRETFADICEDGTFELCGPKVNGNAEHLDAHELIRHGSAPLSEVPWPITFSGIQAYLASHEMEGIVWWLDGEPIGKIKRCDFGIEWPISKGNDEGELVTDTG